MHHRWISISPSCLCIIPKGVTSSKTTRNRLCLERSSFIAMIRSTVFRIPKLVRQSLINASTIGKRGLFLRPSSQKLSKNVFFRMSFSTAAVQEVTDEVTASSSPDPSTSSIKDRLPNWLRPYQVDVIEECIKALDRGVERIGVSSPTGSGKTVML
jgi:hypothetical protein